MNKSTYLIENTIYFLVSFSFPFDIERDMEGKMVKDNGAKKKNGILDNVFAAV